MSLSFTAVPWSLRTNIYEVNVRQYTLEGTFQAFAAHLPRLRDMGVETLWFMPITPISMECRQGTLGSYYACSDYQAVNPEFGSLEDFRNLVQQAHALGFKVIIDWVANHTGWDHVWVSRHPGFYMKNAANQFYDKNGWHDVIDLNYYDAALRRAMIDAMAFWVRECNIDGFRCDMAHLVPLDFWRQAREALQGLKPLFWLAETENSAYLQVFDCCYAWHWMHETEKYFKGSSGLQQLRSVLHRYRRDFPPSARHLFFTTNHDENSWNGTEYEKYGNAAALLAVFSATWYGIPLVYSGQELPNTRRLKFFDKDLIEWTHAPVLHDFYKKLLELRSHHPAMEDHADTYPIELPAPVDDQVLIYIRRKGHQQVLVALNFSENPLFVEWTDPSVHGSYTHLFTGAPVQLSAHELLAIKPRDYWVLVR